MTWVSAEPVQPDEEKRQIAAGGHRKALFLAMLDVQKPRVRLGGIGRAEADDELFFTDRVRVVFAQQGADTRVIPAA